MKSQEEAPKLLDQVRDVASIDPFLASRKDAKAQGEDGDATQISGECAKSRPVSAKELRRRVPR
jgi:hypothetical protein